MIPEITAGLTALNALTDLGKNVLDVATGEKVRTAVVAVREQLLNAQERALDAQAREAALVSRVGELEAKIAKFETWDHEKQRYQLQELPPGMFVYALKPEARGSEPDHKICATCYQNRIQSILHHDEQRNGVMNWHCYTCGFKGQTGHFVAPRVNTRNPEGGGGPQDWMGR